MNHDDGAIRYVKWNILPLFQGSHAVSHSNPIVLICDGRGLHMTYGFFIFCRELGVVLVLQPLYTTAALQGEDHRNFGLVKRDWRVARHKKLAQLVAKRR